MDPRRRAAFGLTSVLIVAAIATGSGIAAGTPVDPDAGLDAQTSLPARNVTLTQRLHLTPETPGEIAVTLDYSIPEGVTELRTRIPDGATVTGTRGFVRRGATEFAWTRESSRASVTYRVSVNETLDATGPIAGRGEYVFVDPGPWALISVPPTSTGWASRADAHVGFSKIHTTEGPGAVGDVVAFLGEHRTETRTAHDQRFRLVVPAAANLAESTDAILDSVTAASHALRVGDRDADVFMVAAPTSGIRWGVRGLQTGDADVWVRDVEELDTADNTWIHEYVHTRQDYTATDATRWFTEATASYYAALLALEQDRIGFEAFRERLAVGSDPRIAGATLSNPSTWRDVAPYLKGALVAGELDRRIRLATDRGASLQTVFSRMNAHAGPLAYGAFREMVREVAGDPVATLVDRYVTTAGAPSMWARKAHDAAFSPTPARIGVDLPDSGDEAGYRVSGPYRSGGLGTARPLRIAAGETIAFDVRVINEGGTAGEFDLQLRVNGQGVARRTGRLGAGETTTVSFSRTFTDAGEYTLSVGGRDVAVSVRDPATPVVSGLSARRTERDGAVAVEATIENDAPIPAAGDLTLYQDGVAVATRTVALAPGGTTTISFDRTLDPGEHVFRVGDASAAVTIPAVPDDRGTRTRTSKRTRRSPDATGQPGFGAALAILALAGIALLGRRR